jgi:hypothetical protein
LQKYTIWQKVPEGILQGRPVDGLLNLVGQTNELFNILFVELDFLTM